MEIREIRSALDRDDRIARDSKLQSIDYKVKKLRTPSTVARGTKKPNKISLLFPFDMKLETGTRALARPASIADRIRLCSHRIEIAL